jgi:phospholipid/cholesterol/gamma-HCH transport system substrate-binding protein
MRRAGMTPFRAGVLAIAVIAVLSYFGFTRANPFANPFELNAVMSHAAGVQRNTPVRIAGVDVGKVTSVEPLTGGEGAAEVTMEVSDKALPLHEDASIKLRSRIFLEGNLFVDLRPGSPSAEEMEDGGTIPVTRTAAPVQLGQVLTVLQSDVRADLGTFLREYSRGLEGKGARGAGQAIRYWTPAYRNAALANDAALGVEPDRDLERLLRGQAETAAALVADERALRDLVTNFNTTAAAFAREDAALEAAVPALRDTLRAGRPALGSLNDALPSLRRFAVEALPGVRSSRPALDAAIPFITQARRLVRRSELRGLAAELRRHAPDLVRLNRVNVGVLGEARTLARCTNRVLVPFSNDRFPNIAESGAGEPEDARGQEVTFQLQRSLVGLAGESRLSDGINQWFRGMAVAHPPRVQPAPPPDGRIDQPPPRRPDLPCETQEPPSLAAPVMETPLP